MLIKIHFVIEKEHLLKIQLHFLCNIWRSGYDDELSACDGGSGALAGDLMYVARNI